MRTRVIQSIDDVAATRWNALLADDGNPFVRHAFLAAAEGSGCAAPDTGWYPCHVLAEDDAGNLTGALPLYLKTNPYGEFVFDYAWAGAYQRANLSYYPKLVSAVPFTPATGPRLLLSGGQPQQARDATAAALIAAARELVGRAGASSLHMLFADPRSRDMARDAGLLLRKDCQFHWHNRNYRDFDDFLDGFTSAKRKKVRRERRRIAEAGIVFEAWSGDRLRQLDWDEIMPLYAATFLRRGRDPYLNRQFFETALTSLADSLIVFAGRRGSELAGVAICFRSDSHLYGRYWGALEYIDSMHFETCYYQGIEYCISEGLQVYEPGTQGEHKISRGFVPSETWSAHWLTHPEFFAAVDEYLEREREHVDQYMNVLGEHVPYKRNVADNT